MSTANEINMASTKAQSAIWPLGENYADPLNDQPPFGGVPRTYVIASSPRVGSTLLCDLLGRTAGLGVPTEYLNPWWLRKLAGRFGLLSADGNVPIGPYLSVLFRHRTGPSGFFGLKLQWRQGIECWHSPELRQLLRNSRFIWIRRQDVLGQAVSFAIAMATNQWHDRQAAAEGRKPVEFSPQAVHYALQYILWENWGWGQFFEANGIRPLAFTYEELLADVNGVCQRVCRHVGLDSPPEFDLGHAATERLADERNAAWRRQFIESCLSLRV
jgi:LPS sulfotransferase NodH